MKQTATNQFNDGMNLDLHPIVTPNSVLTDNINGTFITYNGNEFCLQNDRGNICKANLTFGFVPIGIKEHNGVIYIVSCDDNGKPEIGFYPGFDDNNNLDYLKYSKLPNFKTGLLKIIATGYPGNILKFYKTNYPADYLLIKDQWWPSWVESNREKIEYLQSVIFRDLEILLTTEDFLNIVLGDYQKGHDKAQTIYNYLSNSEIFYNVELHTDAGGLDVDKISADPKGLKFPTNVGNQIFRNWWNSINRNYSISLTDAKTLFSSTLEYNGDLVNQYVSDITDLQQSESIEKIDKSVLGTTDFKFDKNHPVQIEIQDSYDGSVNLILTDGENKPKIINSGFSVIGNKYEIIQRNTEELDQSTDDSINLIRENSTIANIDLLSVQSGGQLKGGNYTFYVKFGDSDYNQTDVVAESGIVSIFNGTDGVPSTISGTLADERTDKMVQLNITGINNIYSKLYVYFSREYSDTNGFRMSEAGMITEPFDIQGVEYGGEKTIWITGYEPQESISIEDLNIDYHTIDFAKTAAQQQDMLFLGNVGQLEAGTNDLYADLKEKTYKFTTRLCQWSTMESIDYKYEGGKEYYSTENIYKYLGYWPGEIYRFGVVYILNDGSTTPVFNMCGGEFKNFLNNQITDNPEGISNWNKYGIFKTHSSHSVIQKSTDFQKTNVRPLYFEFTPPNEDFGDSVVGWFIVRQKRIPKTICQGLSIGIDKNSGLPAIKSSYENWTIESFLSMNRDRSFKTKVTPKLYYTGKVLSSLNDDVSGNFTALVQDRGLIWAKGDFTYIRQLQIGILDYLYKSILKDEWLYVDVDPPQYYLDIDHVTQWETRVTPTSVNIIGPKKNIHIDTDGTKKCVYLKFADSDADWEEAFKKNLLGNYTVSGIYKKIYGLYDGTTLKGYIFYYYLNDGSAEKINIKLPGETSETELNVYDMTPEDLDEANNRFIDLSVTNLYGSGLISLDPCVNNTVRGMLDGSKFNVVCTNSATAIKNNDENTVWKELENRDYEYHSDNVVDPISAYARCTFIPQNTVTKVIDDYVFSNVAGSATSVSGFKHVGEPFYLKQNGENLEPSENNAMQSDSTLKEYVDVNIVRGNFCPYIGITNDDIGENTGIYSIQLETNYNDFIVRQQDNSPYFTVSNRIRLSDKSSVNVFRGDCYTNTVSIRVLRNFIGTPAYSDKILERDSWKQYIYNIITKTKSPGEAEEDINLSDLNTVDLGYWVTFKCLSSYNLGLRSENPFDTTEYAYFNSPKSFYPLRGMSRLTGAKIEESFLLNDGYNATVGEKRYNLLQEAPYYKSEYDTRIMFSNKQVQDQFTNGYRVFQGLSYHDYDKQYGSIVKLEPWGNNLFCVFEHGCAILPVKEKALMQTTTEQTIHIYGHGVLPDQMSIASADYGSKYAQTIVRTPIGIYGIDTDAKKIWRFSDKQGFETLSDMKIESFLNKCLEPIYNIDISNCDIRTHYNSFKGDVIFTWYGGKKGSNSICYNERQGVWTTKYDWVPIVSENANGEFYSLQYSEDPKPEDSNTVKIYSHAVKESKPTTWYDQQHKFEFEFVVSDPIGVNKVFDNLQIISNNVQPEGLEISVIGDSYMFKRDEVPDMDPREKYRKEYENINTETTSNIHGEKSGGDIRYEYDETLDQSLVVKSQDFNDIYKYGRRIGNIQYRDGIWYAQIEPLRWKEGDKQKEARIRDKWAKIRIRYSGEDLAVITAIKTIVNI